MSEASAPLLSCLSLIFWLVLLALVFSWISRTFLPQNPLFRRATRSMSRLIFVEPFRAIAGMVRWFVRALHDTRPDYRRHQVFFERYPVTPLELYGAIEDAFLRRNIVGMTIDRVSRLEWHLFSSRRTYVVIRFREAVCVIGAVPMGNGLLVSWRYSTMPSRSTMMLFEVPYLGPAFERAIAPETFHRTDIYEAFEQSIRGCVTEATNTLMARGIRPLGDNEQRPLLREFYN